MRLEETNPVLHPRSFCYKQYALLCVLFFTYSTKWTCMLTLTLSSRKMKHQPLTMGIMSQVFVPNSWLYLIIFPLCDKMNTGCGTNAFTELDSLFISVYFNYSSNVHSFIFGEGVMLVWSRNTAVDETWDASPLQSANTHVYTLIHTSRRYLNCKSSNQFLRGEGKPGEIPHGHGENRKCQHESTGLGLLVFWKVSWGFFKGSWGVHGSDRHQRRGSRSVKQNQMTCLFLKRMKWNLWAPDCCVAPKYDWSHYKQTNS